MIQIRLVQQIRKILEEAPETHMKGNLLACLHVECCEKSPALSLVLFRFTQAQCKTEMPDNPDQKLTE